MYHNMFSIISTVSDHFSLFPLICKVDIFLKSLSGVSKAVGLTSDSENTGSAVHVLQCQHAFHCFQVIAQAYLQLTLFLPYYIKASQLQILLGKYVQDNSYAIILNKTKGNADTSSDIYILLMLMETTKLSTFFKGLVYIYIFF